jgi:predicted esterase
MPDLGTLTWVALFALLVTGALAPLETLGWWAGWFGDPLAPQETHPHAGQPQDPEDDAHDEPSPSAAAATVDPWVVFMSGIHAVGPVVYGRGEARLIAGLRAALPEGRVVQVFPYSVTNRALTGQRAFAGLWRWALRGKLGQRRLGAAAGFLINARNFWQVLVSADRRYGPMYNRGTAALVVRALRRRGYVDGGRLVLIGFSGGGQIALGATPYLKEATGAEIVVASLGGVMAADPGVLDADRVLHLHGRRDRVQRWGAWPFPGRWRILPWSPWNVARRRGTLRSVTIGPCDHTGAHGYLDDAATVPDGRSYLDVTVDVLAAVARGVAADRLPVADVEARGARPEPDA